LPDGVAGEDVACALVLPTFHKYIPISSAGGRWLVALITSGAFALIGILVPNLYRQASEELRRAHNGVKILHEFLARHLLIYITYFMALSLTATFYPHWEWTKTMLTLIVGITIACYVLGVYLSTYHDRFFISHHACPGKDCHVEITGKDVWKLCRVNAIMAGALLLIGVGSIFIVQ
jgi:hypothetical protein